ncbi:glycoside hydrolase family 2 [Mucilaginibacter rubeus]|uniref:beta-galactosidase n=1 Tax=Mucilaginibacter rubeus TaxID=2027860 RepID=A0AAE6JGS9_9SPHI|nr:MULTISPECIES: glycoside hydrolase family 2 TIM barrel-domain containing protein [Mucilaginibacter]QEM05276.1 glycoside hydrolase family 2 [Mucilaginibacter rubeus]QEM17867.1 glycoside hydrolase family 2 [Mucilaginibacter gossypii]QTE45600.1 glycoside hydrolase family 2 [Mucilaginibacter rubeus]QTE52197.1 glycoside hydrolase family 2 [Mucilaginibacter rubeus]QTE57286.1 glycoside hydrolase family 2 [Mucilaginibacter rubeus]
MKSACFKIWIALLFVINWSVSHAQETQKLFLSGTGSDHTINWQFYCTAGNNSGKWTTIPVPSNWEFQGFGKYNYGLSKDSLRGKEQGLYKYEFNVPTSWQGKDINIVFDGSMTDTEVKLNGKSAGPIHQGSFYRFKYDVSALLNYGKSNLLEVTVSKHSANASVNAAERKGDFWIFGGIFRPVFLEAAPKSHINYYAIDAKANGNLKAQLKLVSVKSGTITGQVYTLTGQKFGAPFSVKVNAGDTIANISTHVVSPKLWSPEFPNLYNVVFTLSENGKAIHTVKQRVGFRTVELREHDGIYVNNAKIKFKGVNRHSFWPTTGRALNKKVSIGDVQLMKDMNMNAVRMSHYPPDDHFLDVCDSLGLFVLDELTGWHHAYDDVVGSKLAKELIEKDINHPSIVLWDNGNEGGFNFNLDHWFDELDLQKRPLIHPWGIFRGTNTQHYINYDYGTNTGINGHDVFFPTEFLHGLYDGGAGAGLDDFWKQMWHTPISAGGFIWDFADEAVVRTDKSGQLDSDGDHGPDGIVGPYHEKEGSYYAIKEIWSPVYLEPREITPAFNGTLRLENRYSYTNLKQCTFSYKLVTINGTGSTNKTGTIASPDVAPGQYGNLQLQLPKDWQNFDVLYVSAFDLNKHELFTWSFPLSSHDKITNQIITKTGGSKAVIAETDSLYKIKTGNGIELAFNRNSGILVSVKNTKGDIPFNNGPMLVEGQDQTGFEKLNYHYEGDNLVVEAVFPPKKSEPLLKWTIYPSGWVQLEVKYWPIGEDATLMGVNFSFPEKDIKGVTYMGDGPYRVWKNRMKGTSLGVWDKTYNNTITGQGKVVYPEFKGYYSNLYWMKLQTTGQPVTIVCNSRDVFMRLFTPANPAKVYNTAPPFPSGDISFMHGITPIGTKSQKPEKLGPGGQRNQYFNYDRNIEDALSLNLYFDFSGK